MIPNDTDPTRETELSARRTTILRRAVSTYLDEARPVSSAALAGSDEIPWSASTVRSELAALEDAGYLTHPHTSAGRVPTDAGYRVYAEEAIERADRLPVRARAIRIDESRREVDSAIRHTTSIVSTVTDLVALATAPPSSSAVIRRVEVLALQPNVLMTIVITSVGNVSRRVLTFADPIDPGLVEWAGSYLNERLAGIGPGAKRIGSLLSDPGLEGAEAELIEAMAPAFELEDDTAQTLYLDGTARILSSGRAEEIEHADALLGALEDRAAVISVLRRFGEERSVFCWIGAESPHPAFREVSFVGANYGLGYRNLGAIGVVGPTRMDYETAIATVREAADELSRFFASVYEG